MQRVAEIQATETRLSALSVRLEAETAVTTDVAAAAGETVVRPAHTNMARTPSAMRHNALITLYVSDARTQPDCITAFDSKGAKYHLALKGIRDFNASYREALACDGELDADFVWELIGTAALQEPSEILDVGPSRTVAGTASQDMSGVSRREGPSPVRRLEKGSFRCSIAFEVSEK